MLTLISSLTGDRRYAPRYYEKIRLYYRIRSSAYVYENWTKSENVSILGIFFASERKICTHTSINVVIEMPEQISAAKWICLGHVVRVVPADGWWGVGLEFDCVEVLRPSQEIASHWPQPYEGGPLQCSGTK